jgi:hypothetical protein
VASADHQQMPHEAFAPAAPRVFLTDLDFWTGAGAAMVLGIVLVVLARRNWKYYDELSSFIEELGARTHEYVSVAIYDPEGFDLYRATRRRADRARGAA